MALTTPSVSSTENYHHFAVAVYARAYEVREMADLDRLQASFDLITRHLKVDKVYLETHRDTLMPDDATLEGAKRFFAERGIRTAGGITYTLNERNRFQTYCYTRPDDRLKVREIAEFTARHFDEFILDDFFFTNCKCPECIEAKSDRSWTEFRLALMAKAAQDLVLAPARAVNPNVKVVIKYPNWYEHFHGLGFNLEAQPALFDGIYTGTETRDPVVSNQHLQPYHGYSIVRYFENIKPGGNGGGWVDPFGSSTIDRYAEQLWITLFAKAAEVTLFDWGQVQRVLTPELRAPWHAFPRRAGIGVDFDAMIATSEPEDAAPGWGKDATIALAAAHAFEKVDAVLGELGHPVGIPAYRPYHASGEDFLHSYLGMLGLPIELVPGFPTGDGTILLTESAKRDPHIADKIKARLLAGHNVVITSGLYRALQGPAPGEGSRIEGIVELEVTDQKALVSEYLVGWRDRLQGESAILVPHIRYLTNDAWEIVSGLTETTGHPILLYAAYAGAALYVLTIPDNFNDLYKLPQPVLARIRAVLGADLPVRLDAPPQVMLFLYDNATFIVESFLDEPVDAGIVLKGQAPRLWDVVSGETFTGEPVLDWRGQPSGETTFDTVIGPHCFRVFRYEEVA